MIHAGNFGATASAAVTAIAGSFVVPGDPEYTKHTYLISSDRNMHIDRLAVAAPSTSMRVPVGVPVRVVCFGGDTISYIRGTGETDGTIWFTVIE